MDVYETYKFIVNDLVETNHGTVVIDLKNKTINSKPFVSINQHALKRFMRVRGNKITKKHHIPQDRLDAVNYTSKILDVSEYSTEASNYLLALNSLHNDRGIYTLEKNNAVLAFLDLPIKRLLISSYGAKLRNLSLDNSWRLYTINYKTAYVVFKNPNNSMSVPLFPYTNFTVNSHRVTKLSTIKEKIN